VHIFLWTSRNRLKTPSHLLRRLGLAGYVGTTMLLIANKDTRRKVSAQVAIKAASVNVESPRHISRPSTF